MKIGYEYSDAGSPDTEDNDCSVRALAVATGVRYSKAHEHLAAFGRRPKGKSPCAITNKAYKNSKLGGYRILPVYDLGKEKPHTLRWFLNTYNFPTRYIVRVNGHVFPIVKGKICDDDYPRLRDHVYTIWNVTRKKQ